MKITRGQPEACFIAIGTLEISGTGRAPKIGSVHPVHSTKWVKGWREHYIGALARTNESAIRKLPQSRVNAHLGSVKVKIVEKGDGEWWAWVRPVK